MAILRHTEFPDGIQSSANTLADGSCSGTRWRTISPPSTKDDNPGWVYFISKFATTNEPMKGNAPKVLIRGDESITHHAGLAHSNGSCRSDTIVWKIGKRTDRAEGPTALCPPPVSRDFKLTWIKPFLEGRYRERKF